MNIPMTKSNNCGCRLALAYAKWKDTAGNTYCHICYQRLL